MIPLTPEQCEALEAMEKAFGPTDCLLHNVTNSRSNYVDAEYGYTHWIRRSAKEALIMWGQYKHALTLETPTN